MRLPSSSMRNMVSAHRSRQRRLPPSPLHFPLRVAPRPSSDSELVSQNKHVPASFFLCYGTTVYASANRINTNSPVRGVTAHLQHTDNYTVCFLSLMFWMGPWCPRIHSTVRLRYCRLIFGTLYVQINFQPSLMVGSSSMRIHYAEGSF